MRVKITRQATNYALDQDQSLLRKLPNGGTAPYIEPAFRGDFIERMHVQFGHLSYGSMANAVEARAWWPAMEADLRQFISACPNVKSFSVSAGVRRWNMLKWLLTRPFSHFNVGGST